MTLPDEIMFRKAMSYLATGVFVVPERVLTENNGTIISALPFSFYETVSTADLPSSEECDHGGREIALSILGRYHQAVAMLLARCNTNKFNFEIIERSADVTAFVREYLVKMRCKLVETF
ncbi:hypothetical protein [Acetobacter indonesiensis]